MEVSGPRGVLRKRVQDGEDDPRLWFPWTDKIVCYIEFFDDLYPLTIYF